MEIETIRETRLEALFKLFCLSYSSLILESWKYLEVSYRSSTRDTLNLQYSLLKKTGSKGRLCKFMETEKGTSAFE